MPKIFVELNTPSWIISSAIFSAPFCNLCRNSFKTLFFYPEFMLLYLTTGGNLLFWF